MRIGYSTLRRKQYLHWEILATFAPMRKTWVLPSVAFYSGTVLCQGSRVQAGRRGSLLSQLPGWRGEDWLQTARNTRRPAIPNVGVHTASLTTSRCCVCETYTWVHRGSEKLRNLAVVLTVKWQKTAHRDQLSPVGHDATVISARVPQFALLPGRRCLSPPMEKEACLSCHTCSTHGLVLRKRTRGPGEVESMAGVGRCMMVNLSRHSDLGLSWFMPRLTHV